MADGQLNVLIVHELKVEGDEQMKDTERVAKNDEYNYEPIANEILDVLCRHKILMAGLPVIFDLVMLKSVGCRVRDYEPKLYS
jgi:hypothetical protein